MIAGVPSSDEPQAARSPERIAFAGRTGHFTWTVPWSTPRLGDTLTVIVKGTYELVPGAPARLRAEGEPPSGDVHVDDDEEASLLHPSDFAIAKPRADVVVIGHAHPPGGSTAVMPVAFRLGGHRGVSRRLAVFGDRRWTPDGTPSEPRRFERMPLTHERSFGGPSHPTNPRGTGLVPDDPRHGRPPNVEEASRLLAQAGERPPPASMGPIPMRWPARWSRLGTYDRAWLEHRAPFFPDDFDWSFFQVAPPSQQLPHLRGDEPYALEGLHPEHPVLEGSLPGVEPRVFARTTAGRWIAVPLALDTAIFRPDDGALILLWRALIPAAPARGERVEVLFTTTAPVGAPLTEDEAAARHAAESEPPARSRPGGPPAPLSPAVASLRRTLAEAGVPPVWFAPDLRPRRPLPTVAEIEGHLAREPARRDPQVHGALERLRMGALRGRELRAAVEARLARGMTLADLDLRGADLSGLDLRAATLGRARLGGANLRGALLAGLDLTGARIDHADLTDADLTGSVLVGADLRAAILEGARLGGARLDRAALVGVDGRRAVLDGATGAGAQLAESDWSDARFAGASLPHASLIGARLDRAVLDGAALQEVKLYEARGRDTSLVDADLTGARANEVVLIGARMTRVRAPRSVWDEANLTGLQGHGAVLAGACLNDVILDGALLRGADLRQAQLRRASLASASLVAADLMEAVLEGARLDHADLRRANLTGAELLRADLTGALLDGARLHRTKLAAPGAPA